MGSGGQGKVGLAQFIPSGKHVAMKIFKRPPLDKKDDWTWALREIEMARAAAADNCPWVPKVFASFMDPNSLYIVMVGVSSFDHTTAAEFVFQEYCRAGSIRRPMRQEKFKPAHFKSLFAQLCRAVWWLHERSILHRDLKPENILLTADGYIRIADYGLATRLIDGNKRPNAACGTPGYKAPEVYLGEKYGFPADMWALGAIIFEVVALLVSICAFKCPPI